MPNINKYKYLKALNYTYKLHYNQFRKKTNIPYFFHLSAVSNLIIENGGTTIEAIAGLLHDAVEDQGGQKTLKEISKKFGKKVEKIVLECTDTDVDPKPPWEQRKLDYLKEMKSASQSALFVSLCDKLHNLTSIIEDYKKIKNKLWKRFNAPPKKLFWYYEQLYFNYKKYLKKHQILKTKYLIALKDMRTITLPLAWVIETYAKSGNLDLIAKVGNTSTNMLNSRYLQKFSEQKIVEIYNKLYSN